MTLKNNLNLQIAKSINFSQIFPRIKEERTRNFATISMSLLAVMFFGIFAISPTFGTISQINKQIQDDQFLDTQLTAKITNLTRLQEQYVLLQNSIPIIETAIPTTAQTTLFLAQLQAVAQESNVQLSRAQILPVEVSIGNSTNYNSFAFSVDAVGSKSTIDDFLKNLSNFNRLILITDFSIVEESSDINQSRIDIKGKAFFKS